MYFLNLGVKGLNVTRTASTGFIFHRARFGRRACRSVGQMKRFTGWASSVWINQGTDHVEQNHNWWCENSALSMIFGSLCHCYCCGYYWSIMRGGGVGEVVIRSLVLDLTFAGLHLSVKCNFRLHKFHSFCLDIFHTLIVAMSPLEFQITLEDELHFLGRQVQVDYSFEYLPETRKINPQQLVGELSISGSHYERRAMWLDSPNMKYHTKLRGSK